MPRYFLHVRTCDSLIEDEEGIELPHYTDAIIEAVRGLRCLMAGDVSAGTLCLDQSIDIHDAAGEHLTTVPFAEAVRLLSTADRSDESQRADTGP